MFGPLDRAAQLVGMADRRRDIVTLTLLGLAIVSVLLLIIDLDQPESGILTVNQQAIEDLLQRNSRTES